MSNTEDSIARKYRERLERAGDYGEVWNVVKDSVAYVLNKHRSAMMLFLDDLDIRLGAYHPIGTNNIVLNRVLVQIAEASLKSKAAVNALIYNLLLHEYLHALGEYSEIEVRRLVHTIARKCFGDEHVVALIATRTPWALLKDIPLQMVNPSKRVMEIVKNFEKPDRYIV